MRVLVVGAGAVGQTFARTLQQGGAHTAFLVKPRYADEVRAGLTLYDLARGGRSEPLTMTADEVLTSADEVAQAEPFDAILLTVSSTALKSGTWFEELCAAAPEATIVGMQPGLGDPEWVRARAGAERVAWGIIELMAYQAPLQGEQVPRPGIAFYAPWWLPFPFSGPADLVDPFVAVLRRGGARAKRVDDVEQLTATGAPAMNLHMAALETAGWSLEGVRRDRELLALTHRAVQQATAVAAHEHQVSVPLWTHLVRPSTIRLLAAVAPRVLPLDVETFLAYHFTKVGDQTRAALDRWIGLAERAGLPHDALVTLRDRREATRRAA